MRRAKERVAGSLQTIRAMAAAGGAKLSRVMGQQAPSQQQAAGNSKTDV
jgi:hypothetical protein